MARILDHLTAARMAVTRPVTFHRLFQGGGSVYAMRIARLSRAGRAKRFLTWDELAEALNGAPAVQRDYLRKGEGATLLKDFNRYYLTATLILAPSSRFVKYGESHVQNAYIERGGTVAKEWIDRPGFVAPPLVVKEVILEGTASSAEAIGQGGFGGRPDRLVPVRRIRARTDGSFEIESFDDASIDTYD